MRRFGFPFLLVVTGNIRIVHQVESTVGEHASGANWAQDFPEHPSGPKNERIVAWKAELCEILGFFDVRCHYLTTTVPTASELP